MIEMEDKIIFGKENKTLELVPLEYEFANSDDKYDANWLKVKLVVEKDHIKFSTLDPFILTFELPKLFSWLEDFDKSDKKNVFKLLESGIEFIYDVNIEELTIELTWNLHPFGIEYYSRTRESFEITFKKEELDLYRIKKQIGLLISKFPEIIL
jgi:hypothetical protein